MEEFPTEYPQQTEDSGGGTVDGSSGTVDGSGTPTNTGSGSTGTGSGSPFINIGGETSSGSGSILDAAKNLLSRLTGLNMTAPKPKAEEKKEEEIIVNAPAPAPIAANNATKVKPWMWYVGGAVLGLLVVGGFIWYKRR